MSRSSERDELFTPARSDQMDEQEPLSLEDDADVQAEIAGNPAPSADNATSVSGNQGDTGAERRFRLSSSGSGSAVDRFERILNTRIPDRQPPQPMTKDPGMGQPPADPVPGQWNPRDQHLVDLGPPQPSPFVEQTVSDSPAMMLQMPATRYQTSPGTQLGDANGNPLTLGSTNAPFVGPPSPVAEPTGETQIAPSPAPVPGVQGLEMSGLVPPGLVGSPALGGSQASVGTPALTAAPGPGATAAPDRAAVLPVLQSGEPINTLTEVGNRSITGQETQNWLRANTVPESSVLRANTVPESSVLRANTVPESSVVRANTVPEPTGSAVPDRRSFDLPLNLTNASATGSDVRRSFAGTDQVISGGTTAPSIATTVGGARVESQAHPVRISTQPLLTGTEQVTRISTQPSVLNTNIQTTRTSDFTNSNIAAQTSRVINPRTADVAVIQPTRSAEQPARGLDGRTAGFAVSQPARVVEQSTITNASMPTAISNRVILQVATTNATIKDSSTRSVEQPVLTNQTQTSNLVQPNRATLQVATGKEQSTRTVEQLGQPSRSILQVATGKEQLGQQALLSQPAATRSVEQPARGENTRKDATAIEWRAGNGTKRVVATATESINSPVNRTVQGEVSSTKNSPAIQQPVTLTWRQPMPIVEAQPSILRVVDQRTVVSTQNNEVRTAVSTSNNNEVRTALSTQNIDRAVQVTYFQMGNQIYVIDRRLVQSSEHTAAGDNSQTAAGSAYILAGALLASRRLRRRKRNANLDSSIEYSYEPSSSESAETGFTTNGANNNNMLLERTSTPTRCTYMVQPGDSLSDLAQLIWQDKDVAWLILQVNQFENRWQDNTCIVKLAARQIIEIPLPEEVIDFQKIGKAGTHRHHQMLTIISYSQTDREVKSLLRA